MHPAGLCRVPLSLSSRPTGGRPCQHAAVNAHQHTWDAVFMTSPTWLTCPFCTGVGHVYRQPKSTFHARQPSLLLLLSHGRPACFARGSAMPACSRKRPPALVGCRFHDITPMADLPVSRGGQPCRHAAVNAHQHTWDAVFMTSPTWLTCPFCTGVGHVYRQPKSTFHSRQLSLLPLLPHGRPACFARGSAMFIDSPNPPSMHANHRFCPFSPMADLPVLHGGRPCRHVSVNAYQRSWDAVFMTSPTWPTCPFCTGVGHVYRQPKSTFYTRQPSFLPLLSRGRPRLDLGCKL